MTAWTGGTAEGQLRARLQPDSGTPGCCLPERRRVGRKPGTRDPQFQCKSLSYGQFRPETWQASHLTHSSRAEEREPGDKKELMGSVTKPCISWSTTRSWSHIPSICYETVRSQVIPRTAAGRPGCVAAKPGLGPHPEQF